MEERVADISFQNITEINGFNSIPLKKVRFMAALPFNAESTGPQVPIEYFNKRTFISLARGIDYEIHNLLVKHKVSPMIKISSTGDNTIISMVESSLGVSILPALILEGNKGRVQGTLPTHKTSDIPRIGDGHAVCGQYIRSVREIQALRNYSIEDIPDRQR